MYPTVYCLGTVDTEGKINTLPRVENTIIDFSLLRSLNINKPRRTRRSLNLLNYTNFKTLISAIFDLESELCQQILLCEVETMIRQELNTPTRTESGESRINTPTRTESGESRLNTPTKTESGESLIESCKEMKTLKALKHIDCRWHILN